MRRTVALLVLAAVAACGNAEDTDSSQSGDTEVTVRIDLPSPAVSGGDPLTDTLTRRRSVRNFRSTPLDLEELSQLLWATQGVTTDAGQRTAPSAGGLYPLEVYLITEAGIYHYEPDQHQLEVIADGDIREELAEAALSQESVAQAPATVAIAAVYARTEQRYGDRAERYVKLEAGHAAQNLLLQAVALDLGAVPIGAFDDDRIAQMLQLPADHKPLYLIPVGRPAT